MEIAMTGNMMNERMGTMMPSIMCGGMGNMMPAMSGMMPAMSGMMMPTMPQQGTMGMNGMMVPRCTMKMEKIAGGMKCTCTCDDKTAAAMMQQLCMMNANGMMGMC